MYLRYNKARRRTQPSFKSAYICHPMPEKEHSLTSLFNVNKMRAFESFDETCTFQGMSPGQHQSTMAMKQHHISSVTWTSCQVHACMRTNCCLAATSVAPVMPKAALPLACRCREGSPSSGTSGQGALEGSASRRDVVQPRRVWPTA